MPFPIVPSPLGGNIGSSTASFFRLNPAGTSPIEPLIDLIPGITPLRVTFDMIDNEQLTLDYDVTLEAIEDITDITSNVFKNLERMTITGTLSGLPPLGIIPPPPVPGSFLRLDLIRLRNLRNLADRREPIMVLTPRYALPRCIIANISDPWTPQDAESSIVSVSLIEARIVSPITGELVTPDFASQTPGNNASSGGGQQAPSGVETQTVAPASALGNAPTVGP